MSLCIDFMSLHNEKNNVYWFRKCQYVMIEFIFYWLSMHSDFISMRNEQISMYNDLGKIRT
jgi:hypothetical protein